MVDLQDRVFLHHTEEHEYAEGRIEIQRIAREPEREQRKRNGERQREQNGEGMDRAVILRSENHVHKDDGKQKSPQELCKCALQFTSAAGYGGGVFGG